MSSQNEKVVIAREIERKFLFSVKHRNEYESIYFVDGFGMERVNVTRSKRIKEYRDFSKSKMFTQLKDAPAGGIYIGDFYHGKEGDVLFQAGIHKTDNDIGEFVGIIGFTVNMNGFFSFLDSMKVNGENVVWVYASDEKILKRPVGAKYLLDPMPYISPKVQTTARILNVKEGIIVYRDFSILPDQQFVRIIFSVPIEIMQRDVRLIMQFFVIIFIIGLFFSLLIAIYFAKRISQPIIDLASASVDFAKGELTTRVKVKATGELKILVDSFNKMVERLTKTTVSRDSLVKEIGVRHSVEKELLEKMEDLRRFQKTTIDREHKMIELKKEINKYAEELGRPLPYDLSFLNKNKGDV